MTPRVERLTPSDTALLRACAALERQCLPEEGWHFESLLAETQKPGGIVLAALDGETVCGVLTACIILDEAELTTIGIAPGYRRKGIASLLMETFRQLADGADMFLEVRQSNAPAIALYRKYGFAPAGIRRDLYVHPAEDGVLMKRSKTVCAATAQTGRENAVC